MDRKVASLEAELKELKSILLSIADEKKDRLREAFKFGTEELVGNIAGNMLSAAESVVRKL